MKLALKISILLIFSLLFNQTASMAASSSATISIATISVEEMQDTEVVPVSKKKKKNKHKKRIKDDEKPFPLFALLALISGLLGLGSFFLGIALSFPLYIGIIGAVLSIGALVLGIMALKKLNPKPFSFVGILLGVMGILASIMFMVSVLG